MIFAPHILQIKIVSSLFFDEDMNPIRGKEEWKEIGVCRCDDISAEKKISISGSLDDFKYKVVYDKSVKALTTGTEVRCLNPDGSIRGEGIVKSPVEINYLPYRIIWLK